MTFNFLSKGLLASKISSGIKQWDRFSDQSLAT